MMIRKGLLYWSASFVFLCLISTFTIPAYATGTKPLPSDFKGKKITFLGDSLIGEPRTAVKLIGEELEAVTVNLGIAGSPIANQAGNFYHYDMVSRYRDIPNDSDLIFVLGGLNDFYNNQIAGCDFENYKSDVKKLFFGLKNNYPDADIFIITTPKTDTEFALEWANHTHSLNQYMQVQRDFAHDLGFGLFDFHAQGVLDSTNTAIKNNYVPDGVHFNGEGDKVFAEQVINALKGYYGIHDQKKDNDDSGNNIYTVITGDTLSQIANRNGITLTVLRKLNPEIHNTDHIKVGQKLRLK